MVWCHEVYILVFALSFSVESGRLSSLTSLSIVARVRPTFYKDDMMSRSFHISFCFVILCRIRSLQLTGKPFDCCSCTTYILQRWQPSWFEASVEWPSSDVFAFLLWISPCWRGIAFKSSSGIVKRRGYLVMPLLPYFDLLSVCSRFSLSHLIDVTTSI